MKSSLSSSRIVSARPAPTVSIVRRLARPFASIRDSSSRAMISSFDPRPPWLPITLSFLRRARFFPPENVGYLQLLGKYATRSWTYDDLTGKTRSACCGTKQYRRSAEDDVAVYRSFPRHFSFSLFRHRSRPRGTCSFPFFFSCSLPPWAEMIFSKRISPEELSRLFRRIRYLYDSLSLFYGWHS